MSIIFILILPSVDHTSEYISIKLFLVQIVFFLNANWIKVAMWNTLNWLRLIEIDFCIINIDVLTSLWIIYKLLAFVTMHSHQLSFFSLFFWNTIRTNVEKCHVVFMTIIENNYSIKTQRKFVCVCVFIFLIPLNATKPKAL